MQEPCMRNDSFLERNSGGSQALRYAMNTAVDESDTSREESHSPKTVLLQPLDEHVGRKKANQIPFGIKNLSRSSSENSTFENYPLIIKNLDDVIDSAEYLNEDAFQNCGFEYNLDVNFLNYHRYQEPAQHPMPPPSEYNYQTAFYEAQTQTNLEYMDHQQHHQQHQQHVQYAAHVLAARKENRQNQSEPLSNLQARSVTPIDYTSGLVATVAYPSKTTGLSIAYPAGESLGSLDPRQSFFPQHYQDQKVFLAQSTAGGESERGAFGICNGSSMKSSKSGHKRKSKAQQSSLLGGETRKCAQAKKSKLLHGANGSSNYRSSSAPNSPRKRRTSFPRSTTKALKEWLKRNILNPYPSEEEKKKLCTAYNLTCPQLQTWFINARIRLWKPCIEHIYNSKKQQLKRMESITKEASSQYPNSTHCPEKFRKGGGEVASSSSNSNNSVSGAMKMISKLRTIPDVEAKIQDQVEKFLASV